MMAYALPSSDLAFQPPALAALEMLSSGHASGVPSTRSLDARALRDAVIEQAVEDEAPASIAPLLVRGAMHQATVLDPEAVPMVLPIVDVDRCSTAEGAPLHLMTDAQLMTHARGLGWQPRIVRARDTESRRLALSEAMTWARHELLVLRALAREGVVPSRISWPVVLLRDSGLE